MRREAVLTRPLHRRARTPRRLLRLRHAEETPAVLRLADAGARRQAEPLADLGRDELVLARPARVGSAGIRLLRKQGGPAGIATCPSTSAICDT